jgi:16S rRNA (guanine966-N2)-methyltransferase
MRIVSGRFKGKVLAAPSGQATRPTSDRARQAVFNILEHAPWSPGLLGRRVLDLFAGTGALGLEALSRGASFALFVDTDPDARAAISENVQACAAQGISRVWKRDAGGLGPPPPSAGAPYDLVFLDPPYGKGLEASALEGLTQGWLAPEALIVVERSRSDPPMTLTHHDCLDRRDYGAATVSFLRWTGGRAT